MDPRADAVDQSLAGAEQIRLGALSVAYRHAGSGPPLVLLHGFSHDSRVWRPQLHDLARRFTVIAWDAPGAGASSDPPEPFGISDWARVLGEFLDALGVTAAHIAGLSWGGLLAQELYRHQPDRVWSLTLADTYAGWRGSLSARVADKRLAACLRDSRLPPAEFVPRYLPGMLSASAAPDVGAELAAIMADFHPLGFRLMATALAVADTRNLLPSIDVPTLLMWGSEDVRSRLTVAHQFQRAIAGARLVVIEGAGHISNLERPGEFDSAVRDFVRAL